MNLDIYNEFLLGLARAPHNNHALACPTCSIKVYNEGCADELTLYVKIEEGVVREASFTGTLCALSTASASLGTEHLIGKTLSELTLLTPGTVYELLRVPIQSTRTRCALLWYDALQKILITCSLSNNSTSQEKKISSSHP
jgi:nitrogen fixation protein NifU and related proteins